jgi:Abortive infection alpha
MSDPENTTREIALAVAKEAYSDLAKPSLSPIGEAISGITKALLHYPRYWARIQDISLDEKVKRFQKKLEVTVEKTPENQRTLPHPSILGPSIQALEYAIIEDDIADMFANLIANSMDLKSKTHPAYVSIIKEMHPKEAVFIREYLREDQNGKKISDFKHPIYSFTASCDTHSMTALLSLELGAILIMNGKFEIFTNKAYGYPMKGQTKKYKNSVHGYIIPTDFDKNLLYENISNLTRLGVLDFSSTNNESAESEIYSIKNEIHSMLEDRVKAIFKINEYNIQLEMDFKFLKITQFGKNFIHSCVIERESRDE